LTQILAELSYPRKSVAPSPEPPIGPLIHRIQARSATPNPNSPKASSPPLPAPPARLGFQKKAARQDFPPGRQFFFVGVQQAAPQVARMSASYDSEWFFIPAQYLRVQSAVSFSIAAM
jgi:hypothetical protein